MKNRDIRLTENKLNETHNSQAISVLVVDDEPSANSFSSSLFTLQNSIVDVVVTDVQMPNGTGIDFLNEINKMKAQELAVKG